MTKCLKWLIVQNWSALLFQIHRAGTRTQPQHILSGTQIQGCNCWERLQLKLSHWEQYNWRGKGFKKALKLILGNKYDSYELGLLKLDMDNLSEWIKTYV